MTLGEQLALFRRRLGKTQDEIGAKSGISGNTIGRIEAGDPSPRLDQLERICDALGLEFNISLAVRPEIENTRALSLGGKSEAE